MEHNFIYKIKIVLPTDIILHNITLDMKHMPKDAAILWKKHSCISIVYLIILPIFYLPLNCVRLHSSYITHAKCTCPLHIKTFNM